MARPLTSMTFEPSFRDGSGKPLVLIHGGTGTWHAWRALLPSLTEEHDVLAPTLPGDRRVRRIFVGTDRLLRTSRPLLGLTMRSSVIRRLGFRYVAAHGDRLTAEEALVAIEGALNTDLLGHGRSVFDHVCGEFADPGVPTLVAWGEKDRLLASPRYAEGWRRGVPWAEWRVLPGVGHLPMFDDPELVATTIRDWVAQSR